jgi:hypothetical protein
MVLSYTSREHEHERRPSAVAIGDRIYSSLNNDWDLDEAFLNASDPYLYIMVEAEKNGLILVFVLVFLYCY